MARVRLQVRLYAILFGVLLVASSTGASFATTIVDPDLSDYMVIHPISATLIHGADRTAVTPALYNGDGLDGTNPLLAPHGNDPSTAWIYEAGASDYPVSLEFDLGGNFLVTEMWLWQLQGTMADYGVREFDVIMKDANGTLVGQLTTNVEQLKAAEFGPVVHFSAFGDCILLPFPDCVRFVELAIRENLGNAQFLGLAEVAFAGRQKGALVPEPSALALSSLGLLMLAARCRRRK